MRVSLPRRHRAQGERLNRRRPLPSTGGAFGRMIRHMRHAFSVAASVCAGPCCDQSPRAIRTLRDIGCAAERIIYYRSGMRLRLLLGLSVRQPEDQARKARTGGLRQGTGASGIPRRGVTRRRSNPRERIRRAPAAARDHGAGDPCRAAVRQPRCKCRGVPRFDSRLSGDFRGQSRQACLARPSSGRATAGHSSLVIRQARHGAACGALRSAASRDQSRPQPADIISRRRLAVRSNSKLPVPST